MVLKAFQPLQEYKRCWRREKMASCKNFWTDQRNSIPKMAAEHLYLNVSLAGCILGSPSAQTVQRSLLPFRALTPRDSSLPRHSAPSPMNSLALHPFCVVGGRRGGKIDSGYFHRCFTEHWHIPNIKCQDSKNGGCRPQY